MKIGEFAKMMGMPISVLRHYDKEGLLCPDNEEPQLILEPEKPENKGKFVVTLLQEWRFYLKFISIQ